MKFARTLQIIILVLLVGYLMLVGYKNPNTIILPLFIPLPTEWVLGLALVMGFLAGWVSLSGRVFRLNRQNRVLHQRLIKAGLDESEPVRKEKRSRPPLGPPRG